MDSRRLAREYDVPHENMGFHSSIGIRSRTLSERCRLPLEPGDWLSLLHADAGQLVPGGLDLLRHVAAYLAVCRLYAEDVIDHDAYGVGGLNPPPERPQDFRDPERLAHVLRPFFDVPRF